ncbi:FAD-binding oxidoreductase [Streptomyces sp. NPDC006692]|uniref:FAD-binding oxidoreductase n=1 Tax=Streptomyces sp. NPDC006692 TaxID=3364758 RepID=UPI0036CDAA76
MSSKQTDGGLPVQTFHPDDSGYQSELAGYQLGFAQRPDVVFAAESAADVQRAVRYAAERGLPVGVHATGHGLARATAGGVLITTRRMDSLTVDAGRRTVRLGAGVSWGQVVAAAVPHGLAPLNGSAPSVGAVGYTLGGGLGILAREFGYAADHVRALEVVTADGALREVTAVSDPELFWGLLGGGANLGVVTALETALVPVARLYGGQLGFDGELFGERVLEEYLRWTETVPDGLTSSLQAIQWPDAEWAPAPVRGRYVVSVRVAFTGSAEEGERLAAPLRAIGPALTDDLREMAYAQSPSIHRDPEHAHPYYGNGAMLRGVTAAALSRALRLTGPEAPTMCVAQLNHLGGALAKPAPNAVPHRTAEFLLRVLTPFAEDQLPGVRALHQEVLGALAPWTLGRSLNFTFGDAEFGGTKGLYGEDNEKRLAALKSLYDPANLFRGNNYNVVPK